jgi:hypothetical protein
MPLKGDIRHLFTFRESPVRWPIALQAALAMGLPIIGFTLAGRGDLGLLASPGAFTALYLPGRSRHERAVLLPLVALGLVAACAIGVLVSGSLALSLVALFVVVVVAGILCLGFGVGPPGPLFFVLLAGVSAHLAAPKAGNGAGIDGGLVVAMLALGCAAAYLIVLAPLAVPSVRARDAAAQEDAERVRFELGGEGRVILFRIVLAAAIGLAVAAPLGVVRAYWILVTVVAILQNGRHLRLTALRGVHRVLGTLVGVGVYTLLTLVRPQGLWLAALLMALQFSVEIVVVRNYGLALVLITPLALTIATQRSSGNLATVATERVVDTLIGAAVALSVLVVALAVRRRRPATPRLEQ